jgi:hypothetical protein
MSEERAINEEEKKIQAFNDSRRNSSLSLNRGGTHGGSVISNSNKESELSSHDEASLTPKEAINTKNNPQVV